MTDEELIARLRDFEKVTVWEVHDAADRIEALTEERDRWKDACRSASRDLNIVVPDNDRLKSERDAAEAKLAKAVEALEIIRDRQYYRMGPGITAQVIALATLAAVTETHKIKGESHE